MATIHDAFKSLVNSKEAESNLNTDQKELLKFRYVLTNRLPISIGKKFELLTRTGLEQDLKEYHKKVLPVVLK